MNKIYIVHRWEGTKNSDWYPWLESKLVDNHNKIYRFDMPDTENPIMEKWVGTLEKMVDKVDDHTFFVGHSIGCQTILRYLEKVNPDNIGGVVLVAPWLDLLPAAISDEESYNTAKPWLETPIDFAKLHKFADKIVCLFSNNDYFVSEKEALKFSSMLGAKTKFIGDLGHISEEDGAYEVEEIYEELSELIDRC